MPIFDPATLDRYATGLPDRPATFAERGVSVPFTAPVLAAARLRRMGSGEPELLLPGLGGRGIYVLGWESCVACCAPTLHDRALWAELEKLTRPTPPAVRALARAVASSGIAGRPAQAAARARCAEVAAARDAVRAALSPRLPAGPRLEALVEALTDISTGPEPAAALAARLRALERFAAEVSRHGGTADPRIVTLLAGAARLTRAAVSAGLEPLRAGIETLSAPTGSSPDDLIMLAERIEWLLDGWDAIVALWTVTPLQVRDTVLGDALVALPVPALEADGWPGPAADWGAVLRGRRLLAPRPNWATCRRAPLVARNERLRAFAA